MELLSSVNDTWLIKATFGAILIFILKDWIKSRRTPEKVQCAEQESCAQVQVLHDEGIRTELTLKEIKDDLKAGDKKFDTMSTSVGQIEKDMAVVAAIMQERHQTGGELFQKK